jgi:hypothetical protein
MRGLYVTRPSYSPGVYFLSAWSNSLDIASAPLTAGEKRYTHHVSEVTGEPRPHGSNGTMWVKVDRQGWVYFRSVGGIDYSFQLGFIPFQTKWRHYRGVSDMHGGSIFLRNVGIYLLHHTALQPRRPTSTSSPPWEPQISWSRVVPVCQCRL